MSASMREAQAADWLDDLREFAPAIVEEACRRWRRANPDRRPGPGHIRALCIEERRERQEGDRLKALPPPARHGRPALSEDLRRQARELSNRLARDRGYEDFDAYLAAGGSVVELAGLPPVQKRGAAPDRPEFNPSPERLATDHRALVESGFIADEGERA